MQVAQHLRHMLVGYRARSFEFHHKPSLNQQVGTEIPQNGSIFIVDRKQVLLLNNDALLSQAMNQGIFVDLFDMAVAVIAMNRKTRLTDDVT